MISKMRASTLLGTAQGTPPDSSDACLKLSTQKDSVGFFDRRKPDLLVKNQIFIFVENNPLAFTASPHPCPVHTDSSRLSHWSKCGHF
jgi:hypothetical protein